MLEKALIALTRPLARPENVVTWRDYRVTVLQSGLFRLEKSAKRKFRDSATQVVFFRDMPPQQFTKEEGENSLRIATGRCTLILRPRRRDCTLLLGGKEVAITLKGNLGGTYRTLDNCDGATYYTAPWENMDEHRPLRLGTGVCSRTGVAVLSDENSLTLGEDGQVHPVRGEGRDEYIFAYGSDYREAVRALYLITGFPPTVPRFVLGNWWSRYHAYTAEEYLRLMHKFEERSLPLTVATVDMDWHYSSREEIDSRFAVSALGRTGEEYVGGDLGWTGYTWNEALFPDHRDFLRKLNEMGLKVTLNLHPADGFRYWEQCYGEMARALGRDAGSGKRIPFDITDPAFVNAYFALAHRPYEEEGVRFWWIDWQQGASSAISGLDPLWALNHYHFLDNAARHPSPVILSRYCGVGAHRYPLGFSGDTFVSWKTLGYLPYFTATATNVGYTWWSHDIGGHQRGEMDRELYLRHIQFGVFSPVCRLHGCTQATMTKEPWVYGAEGLAAEQYLRLRHRLIPYLYTFAHLTEAEGRALIEPLYYRHTSEEAYRYNREYYFGDLLVIPAVTKAQRDGYARVRGWLPEGVWTDIFTGDRYEVPSGGKRITFLRRKEEYPVFAKAGTLLPLSDELHFGAAIPQKLTLDVWSGEGEFTLYEDGREEEREGTLLTRFTAKRRGNKLVLTVRAEGADIAPERRTLTVRFKNIPAARAKLFLDGKEQPNEFSEYAAVRFCLVRGREFTVEAEERTLSEEELRLERAVDVLLRAEAANPQKEEAERLLSCARTVEEYRAAVQRCTLPAAVKLRLLETL